MTRSSPHKAGKNILAALDVGSSKIGCLIVERGPREDGLLPLQNMRVLGVGYQRSQGIKGGLVLDRVAAEQSIRAAVDKAERQAGFSIDDLSISMNTGRIHSQNYGAAIELGGGRVRSSHIETLLHKGWTHVATSPHAILHAQSSGFSLDGDNRQESPVGSVGQHLFADFHAVGADPEPVKRLLGCIEDGFLSPTSIIAAPYASALATLRLREMNEGVVVLDLGGGTSSLAVFANGRFVFANSLAKGGGQITSALARQYNMPWRDAERLKIHIGREIDTGAAYPKCIETISRQLVSIFLHQKEIMKETGFAFEAVKYVVLTGGTSLYYDAPRLAAEIFHKPARVGAPLPVSGMPSQLINPSFAALWGIIAYGEERHKELATRFSGATGSGTLSRFGNWLHHFGGR